MALSAGEWVAAIIVPTVVCSVAAGCVLFRIWTQRKGIFQAWTHWTSTKHAWKDTSTMPIKRNAFTRTSPEHRYSVDIENPEIESEGPSPRSQSLLRQLEFLVGRVVENKLEQVLHTGEKHISCGALDPPKNEIWSSGAQTEPKATRSKLSQTEQLDCLTPIPNKWLMPSSPQARKDGPAPIVGQSAATSSSDPAKKNEYHSLRGTTDTLKQRLRAREVQVQNLSAQLKDTRQKLWTQLKEHKTQISYVEQRRKEDPEADEAVVLLKHKINLLSDKLNAENMRASKWAMIAKQQRLFLLQIESLGGEPDALKRHSAGVVFTAPPPLPDDDDYGDLWDVANGAGANPYNVDSWPMEPNALAQRYPKNVPFGEKILEDSETDSDSLSEKEEDEGEGSPKQGGGFRLPKLDSHCAWSPRSERSVRSF